MYVTASFVSIDTYLNEMSDTFPAVLFTRMESPTEKGRERRTAEDFTISRRTGLYEDRLFEFVAKREADATAENRGSLLLAKPSRSFFI